MLSDYISGAAKAKFRRSSTHILNWTLKHFQLPNSSQGQVSEIDCISLLVSCPGPTDIMEGESRTQNIREDVTSVCLTTTTTTTVSDPHTMALSDLQDIPGNSNWLLSGLQSTGRNCNISPTVRSVLALEIPQNLA